MYYFQEILKRFQVPEDLIFIRGQFHGADEALTIWEGAKTHEQYALWERDYMVIPEVEREEIKKLVGFSVGATFMLRPEFCPRELWEAWQPFVWLADTGLAYEVFMVLPEFRQKRSQVNVDLSPEKQSMQIFESVLRGFAVPKLEFVEERFKNQDYVMTIWRDPQTGERYALWHGWFLCEPVKEKIGVKKLTGIKVGEAVALKEYADEEQAVVESWLGISCVEKKGQNLRFELFRLE